MKHSVLITGATGNVGSEVVAELQRRNADFTIASRHKQSGEPTPSSSKTVYLDLSDPTTYASAMQGIDALFLLRPPAIANTKETLCVLIQEARRAGVRRIVFISVAGAGDNRMVPHHAVEQELKNGPPDWTILRPGFFAQNIASAYYDDIMQENRIYVPAGNGKVAFIDLRDVAVIAADALLHLDDHATQTYTLTGPTTDTFTQVAEYLSQATGRTIRYDKASILGYYRHLRRRGMKRAQIVVQTILHVGLRFGQAAKVDDTTEHLLGRTPHSVQEYIADHASLWTLS